MQQAESSAASIERGGWSGKFQLGASLLCDLPPPHTLSPPPKKTLSLILHLRKPNILRQFRTPPMDGS